ncbi:MAG: hypothetical protein K8T20_08740, partial [Planctomycetes bacterium]|nr:hypothetical protein [Planctomycetota bacterium]
DGALVLVTRGGLARRFSVPEFREEARFEIGKAVAGVSVSKEGVVVELQEAREIWVLDSKTLARKAVATDIRASHLACCPSLSQAIFTRDERQLAILDLKSGKVLKEVTLADLEKAAGAKVKRPKNTWLNQAQSLALSPDGKYLFCVGNEALHRIRVSGVNLAYEESGERIGGSQRIEISADSRFVALPAGATAATKNRAGVTPYATDLFRIGDLGTPVSTVDFGGFAAAVAWEKGTGRLYAQNSSRNLIVCDAKGTKQAEYVVPGIQARMTRELLPHPEGRRVLVRTEDGLFWFDLDPKRDGSSPTSAVAEAVPAAGPALETGDELVEVSRLRLSSAVVDLFLSKDGASLFALDLTGGRILKLKASDLSVEAEAPVPDDASAMALNARGDSLFVVARFIEKGTARGRVHQYTTALEAKQVCDVDIDPMDVEATNSGLVVVSGSAPGNSSVGIVVLDPAVKSSSPVSPTQGSPYLCRHPDQVRIYAGDLKFRGLSLTRDPTKPGTFPLWESRYGNDQPLGGNLVISPDGRFLFGSGGVVLRLAATADADLEVAGRTDRWASAAVAPGCDTIFFATADGSIQQYSISRIAPVKTLPSGALCSRLALDPAKKRLYASAGHIGDWVPPQHGTLGVPILLTDIVAWSLEKK